MSKPTTTPPKRRDVALNGGTLANGTHFNAGDALDVSAAERSELVRLGVLPAPATTQTKDA